MLGNPDEILYRLEIDVANLLDLHMIRYLTQSV